MSQMSIKGDKVTLKCRATSTADAPLSFTWKHDNVEIRDRSLQSDTEPTSTGGITLASSVLQLTNVTNAHAGKYQCMVSNNYGTTYSAKAKISVLSELHFIKNLNFLGIFFNLYFTRYFNQIAFVFNLRINSSSI
jgi:hypothetical protein